MNELNLKPTILTVTTKRAETLVSLYSPLTKGQEIQLLNFHKPTLWFKSNSPQVIKQIASEGLLDE